MTVTTIAELVSAGESPLPLDRAGEFLTSGSWAGITLRQVLSDTAARVPDRTAVIGHVSDGERHTLTYRELDAATSQAANALAAAGIAPGDAVAIMVPNWIEYPALMFACHELRAVYVGIPVSYGAMQTLPILRRSRAKAIVIPRGWRSSDHLGLIRSLRDQLPDLETVIVIDEDGSDLVDEVLWSSLQDAPAHGVADGQSAEVCYLGFTSGTTGEPKGAMHTHDTLLHSVMRLTEHIGRDTFGDPMVQLVASPVGHHTGYVWCTLFTVFIGGTAVMVDRWEPQWGADLIRNEGVTAFFGAPTFLQDLMRTDLAMDPECPLRCIVLAGSSVPRTLPAHASEALGAYVARAWGMTECSITLACTPDASDEITLTDGSVFSDSEMRVVDNDDREVRTGDIGELLVKGPSLFLGYYERPDATRASFTSGGWFRTGDTAIADEHGWITLQGRTKDIIIRGGENIPVADIETVLFDHPDIVNVAVVGVPDERLGERACAVVVFAPGSNHDLAELCEYLMRAGLSKHYLPERLLVLDELPMTQSGKIQKFALRELVAHGAP